MISYMDDLDWHTWLKLCVPRSKASTICVYWVTVKMAIMCENYFLYVAFYAILIFNVKVYLTTYISLECFEAFCLTTNFYFPSKRNSLPWCIEYIIVRSIRQIIALACLIVSVILYLISKRNTHKWTQVKHLWSMDATVFLWGLSEKPGSLSSWQPCRLINRAVAGKQGTRTGILSHIIITWYFD